MSMLVSSSMLPILRGAYEVLYTVIVPFDVTVTGRSVVTVVVVRSVAVVVVVVDCVIVCDHQRLARPIVPSTKRY